MIKVVTNRDSSALHDNRPSLRLVVIKQKHAIAIEHRLIQILIAFREKFDQTIKFRFRQLFYLATHPRVILKVLNALIRNHHLYSITPCVNLLKKNKDDWSLTVLVESFQLKLRMWGYPAIRSFTGE